MVGASAGKGGSVLSPLGSGTPCGKRDIVIELQVGRFWRRSVDAPGNECPETGSRLKLKHSRLWFPLEVEALMEKGTVANSVPICSFSRSGHPTVGRCFVRTRTTRGLTRDHFFMGI